MATDGLNRRSLPEVIRAAIEAQVEGMHVALPGKVVSYDAAKQTVSVDCAVKLPLKGQYGEVVYESLPTFPDVPVSWPAGGGYFLSMPLDAGDPVLLVFSDIACGEYLNDGVSSEPVDTRRHSLGYPVAIPGGARPDTKAAADASATALVLGKDGSDSQVRVTATGVELGKGATDLAALASVVDANLSTLRAAINSLGGALAVLPSVAATKVKVL